MAGADIRDFDGGFIRTLALPVTFDANTVGALTFDRRGADFTKRHCTLLDAFAPHFVLAWQRHSNPWDLSPKPIESTRARLQKLGQENRHAATVFAMRRLEGR